MCWEDRFVLKLGRLQLELEKFHYKTQTYRFIMAFFFGFCLICSSECKVLQKKKIRVIITEVTSKHTWCFMHNRILHCVPSLSTEWQTDYLTNQLVMWDNLFIHCEANISQGEIWTQNTAKG